MTKPLSVFDLMASSNTQIQTPTESTEPRPLSVFDLMGDRSRLNADTAAIGRRYAQELDSQALRYPKEATQQLYPMAMKYRSDMDNHFAALGYTEEQRKQILDSFDTGSTFLNPTDGTALTYITDPLKTVGKGAMNFGANVVSAVAPQSDLEHELKSAADAYDVSRSADSQMKALRVNTDIQRDIAGGTNESWATLKHLALNPSQIGNAALENLPQLMFAPAGAAALGAMGVAQGMGSYRNATMEAWKALPKAEAMAKPEIQQRMAQGMTFEQALEDVSTDVSDHFGGIARSAAIGALDTLSPLAKLGAAGQAANRGMVKTFGKEVGKEYLQEGAEQANGNYGVGQIDGTTQLMDGVQQAAVTGALASGPFAAVAAYDAKRNDNRLGAQESKDTSTGSLDADEQDIQQSQSEQTQPAQAVENPQHFAETPDYPELDQFALNKAMETLDEEVRQDYTARLARELANGKVQTRNGKGEFDRFVQDYLAQTQVPEVVRQMEQAASTLPEANATPNTPNPNSSTFGNATEQSDTPALKPTSVQNGGMTEIELGSQGRKPATFQLIEADDLTVNLKPNAYQNRDRTSADSQAQIMAYAANLNPSYLGASVDTTQGAPVVDEHYGVFAGNGRLAAIKQAYAKNPQSATAYRDYLMQNAAQFGLMPEQVQGMRQPVLVRQMSSDIDLKKAVEDSNFNTGLDKGVLGNARANADYLSYELLDLAETNEDGSLSLSESNTPFIQGLVAKVPVEHRQRFFAEKKLGNQTAYTLTAQGRELVENALLVKAYSDGSTYADNLLTDLITGTEDSNKRVKAALISVAGKVIQTKGTDYDISADLVQAYDLVSKGKKAGLNATEAANQGDLLNPPNETVQGLVGLFYSPKSISEVQQPLNAYLDKVIDSKLHQTEQGGLFEDEKPTSEALLREAGLRFSRNNQPKNASENIARGRQAMEFAIENQTDVANAMYREGLGWVDFIWGTEGKVNPNKDKRKGAKGVSHIIEKQMNVDHLTRDEVVDFLENTVPEIIALGSVENDFAVSDKRRMVIALNGNEVHLVKEGNNNAWLLTGFQQKNQEMNQSRGAATSDLRSTDPIRSRIDEVALGSKNVRPTTQDVNSDPEIQQAKAILEKALGKAYADQVNFVRSSDFNDGRATAEGFFQNGKVHIVLDNIYSNDTMNRAERMAWVAWHEFAHNGVDVRFKGNYDAMIEMARSHPVVNVITRRIKAEYETAVANGELSKMPNENTLVEEAFVELYAATKTGNWAEIESRYHTKVHRSWKTGNNSLTALLERIANAMRRMVGRIIGKDLRQTTSDEIFAILKGIDQGVQSLAKNSENQTASGEVRYSLNERADSAFAKAVDDVANGNRTAQPIIDVGTTPDVLKMLGLPDVNVVISGAVLHKVMHGKHNVTPETLKQLPKQINDPVAVMRSETQSNGYVVLTELTEIENGKDKPVISALHLKQDRNGLELINIASVYGRSNAQIQRGLENDLLYWNKEKGAKFLDNLTLQLRSPLSSNSSIGGDIKTEQDLSQYQAENSARYSRQPQELSKSVTDNNGEFSAENEDIRYSRTSYRFKNSDIKLNEKLADEYGLYIGNERKTLEEVLHNSPLFESYPELGHIGIQKVKENLHHENPYGIVFDSNTNTVHIGERKAFEKQGNSVESFLKDFLKEQVKHIQSQQVKAEKLANADTLKALDEEYVELAKRYENGDISVENRLREMVDNQARKNGFGNDVSFRMEHQAPYRDKEGFHTSMDDVTAMFGEDIYSGDAAQLYAHFDYATDMESIRQIHRVRNKPNAVVTIYRAVPKGTEGTIIGNGDWVTTSRQYAVEHGEHSLDGNYRIVSKKVKASELWTNGDSIHEWGYDNGQDMLRSKTKDRNKLNNLITYTDSGKIIPLSKRFNESKTDIRYSRKKSAMDIADAEKVEQHPNLIERVQKGGYAQFKKELTALSAFIDTQLHDRLRPVMDWIDGINLPSLSAYEKAKIKDSIYAAEGIKGDLLVQAELRYLNDIRDKIAAIAKAHFNGHGETAMKKAGLWISTRWAIERNALLLAADEKAMNEAEATYNEAVAKSEPMTVQNRLERALIKAENVYYNRIKDVNSTDFSNDRRYKEGVAGGWSTPLAKAIMAKMESQIPRKELEALAEVVYDLNDWQLKQNVESGRYTSEEAAHFKNQGRHYVPLTGDPSMELDDALRMPSNRNPNVSKDVSLRGRALSEADDAISTVWESMQKTATYSGWAPMKHQFANLYDQAYQQVIASGATPEQAATETKKLTGIEKEKLQGLTRTSDDVLIYKSGGVYYQLSIPEIAITQIKKQNSDNTPPLLKPMQTVTGWYARGVTQFKPHFAMVNMVRDLWEKSELVRTKDIFDKHGKPLPEKVKNQIGREMWKQAFGAIAGQNTDVWLAAKRYARKQELRDNVPAERELKALLKNGGVSTHSTFLERKETDLIKTINKRNSRLAKGIEYALNAVETYNRIFDIISAIAANRALLKHGVDQKHASAVTLDLTNFRKQGDRMPFIKSFYMFAQPAAIGGANLIRMMKTDVGRKRLLMSSLFFGALSFMLRSLFDEDEAGNGLFKEGDIDRYIPIPIPGSDLLFKLPVGYGAPQLSWNLGYNLTQAIMGDKTWGDAAGSVALHAFKAVAPVSPSDVPVSDYPAVKALMTAMPTIVKPIAEIALNRNAFGSPITGAFLNDKSLKAEQAKAQTAPFWTETALWLNDTFGMDFAPEQVKHFVQGYANIVPLASESLTILVENPNKARQGKTESIPFINAVVGSQNQYATQTQFYRFRDQANETVINFESRKTRGTLPESWKSDPDMRWQLNWFARVEEMEKAQRKTKVSLTKAHNTGKLSAEAYQSRLNALAKETEAKQKKLVGAWRFHYGLNTTATKD